ncbi:MAG: hypothetical protein JXA78_16865 [Anaerolineales bacterium]|nr:hypothetical protein [Anaerolineales bacterium]
MIKLPNEMAIYPQSRHNPGYLLCWIPPQAYVHLASGPAARHELERFHPNGIEIPLTEEALQDNGIHLPVALSAIRKAYQTLLENGTLPEPGMVKGNDLMNIAMQMQIGQQWMPKNLPLDEAAGAPSLEAISPDLQQALSHIEAPPEMVGDENAADVFQRLSAGQPEESDEEKGGA